MNNILMLTLTHFTKTIECLFCEKNVIQFLLRLVVSKNQIIILHSAVILPITSSSHLFKKPKCLISSFLSSR